MFRTSYVHFQEDYLYMQPCLFSFRCNYATSPTGRRMYTILYTLYAILANAQQSIEHVLQPGRLLA